MEGNEIAHQMLVEGMCQNRLWARMRTSSAIGAAQHDSSMEEPTPEASGVQDEQMPGGARDEGDMPGVCVGGGGGARGQGLVTECKPGSGIDLAFPGTG